MPVGSTADWAALFEAQTPGDTIEDVQPRGPHGLTRIVSTGSSAPAPCYALVPDRVNRSIVHTRSASYPITSIAST